MKKGIVIFVIVAAIIGAVAYDFVKTGNGNVIDDLKASAKSALESIPELPDSNAGDIEERESKGEDKIPSETEVGSPQVPKMAVAKATAVMEEPTESPLTEVSAPTEFRNWTDASGRSISAQIVTADEDNVLIRMSRDQRIYSVPIARFSRPDFEYVEQWKAENSDSNLSMPPVLPDAWPSSFDGLKRTPMTSRSEGDDTIWSTSHFELYCNGSVEPEMVEAMATTVEAAYGATRSIPLPLGWGVQSGNGRSKVRLHSTLKDYKSVGGTEKMAGHFDPESGWIHIPLVSLQTLDLRQFFQFKLGKRQEFDVLVHEIFHQITPGIINAKFPAWVEEGLAEYFSATQYLPGRYSFQNTHLNIRSHLNNQILIAQNVSFDGVVEMKILRINRLETLMNWGLASWNQASAKESYHTHYSGALIVADHFCHAENNRMRAFIEGGLSGQDVKEAMHQHLLAGRTYAEIERDIAERWKPLGLEILFRSKPTLERGDYEWGVGIERPLSR